MLSEERRRLLKEMEGTIEDIIGRVAALDNGVVRDKASPFRMVEKSGRISVELEAHHLQGEKHCRLFALVNGKDGSRISAIEFDHNAYSSSMFHLTISDLLVLLSRMEERKED